MGLHHKPEEHKPFISNSSYHSLIIVHLNIYSESSNIHLISYCTNTWNFMDSQSLNTWSQSNSCYQPSWRNCVNGKLISYSNKICECHIRAYLRVSKSDDNPHMLCYRCVKKAGCGYFRWQVPDRTDFKVWTGLIFKGSVATVANHELINVLTSEVKELKDMLRNSLQPDMGFTAVKIFTILNGVFFMFNYVMYLMSIL